LQLAHNRFRNCAVILQITQIDKSCAPLTQYDENVITRHG